jgi:hypothetical protein
MFELPGDGTLAIAGVICFPAINYQLVTINSSGPMGHFAPHVIGVAQ